jgi:hypothetical protein
MFKKVTLGFICIVFVVILSIFSISKPIKNGIFAGTDVDTVKQTVIIDAGHGGLTNTIKA